jgi:membrane-associated protease RseP (regulator of RpoE activity)
MLYRVLAAGGVIGATVALHEAAHAVMAVRAGGKVKELGIGFGPQLARTRIRTKAGEIPVVLRALPLGGYAAIDVDEIPPQRRIPLLLAGPLANIAAGLPLMLALRNEAVPLPLDGDRRVGVAGLIGTVSALLRAAGRGPAAVLQLAGAINVGLGIMNLLPIYPLDGGHLAMAYMERRGIPKPARMTFARLTAAIFFWLVQAALVADMRRLRKKST